MHAFIDFEASSLGRHSHPIEVGWILEDGERESHLIRPADGWNDWDPSAEAIHHISREMLVAAGAPHEEVALRLVEHLGSHRIFATAPSWDGKWLSVLLRAAGLPRHSLRLENMSAALNDLAETILLPAIPSHDLHRVVRQVVQEANKRFSAVIPKHRALADAELERDRWLAVAEIARACAA